MMIQFPLPRLEIVLTFTTFSLLCLLMKVGSMIATHENRKLKQECYKVADEAFR